VSSEDTARLIEEYRDSSRDQPESPEKIEILRQLEASSDREVTIFLAEVAVRSDEYDLARIEALKILESRGIALDAERIEVTRALQRILADEEDDEVRSYAARTMANFVSAPGARRLLGRYVLDHDEDEDVRHNAFFALERGGPDPDTRDILKRCLADPELRAAAQRVLHQWGEL
jgi:HEAT repeats